MSAYTLYILTAFALVFVIEGLVYAVFPDAVKRMMALAISTSSRNLRAFGISATCFGFLIVWIINLF